MTAWVAAARVRQWCRDPRACVKRLGPDALPAWSPQRPFRLIRAVVASGGSRSG